MTIPQVFEAIFGDTNGNLFGAYTLRTEGGVDTATGRGKGSSFWFYSACGVEVELDLGTGRIRVLRAVSGLPNSSTLSGSPS